MMKAEIEIEMLKMMMNTIPLTMKRRTFARTSSSIAAADIRRCSVAAASTPNTLCRRSGRMAAEPPPLQAPRLFVWAEKAEVAATPSRVPGS